MAQPVIHWPRRHLKLPTPKRGSGLPEMGNSIEPIGNLHMSEETATPTPADLPDAPSAPEQITLPDDHPLVKAYASIKEQNRGLKQRVGDLEPAAQKLQEIEDANKSELEKLSERLAESDAKLAEYEDERQRAAIVAAVAKQTGVDAEILALTKPASEEEAVANAEKLAAATPKGARTPDSSIAGNRGSEISVGSTQLTAIDLKTMTPREIRQARKEGRLDDLLGVNK